MGATDLHAYPYPEGADQPVVHQDLQAALAAVDEDTFIECTAATRPAHLAGRRIFETDTDATYVSDGTTWLPLSGLYGRVGSAAVGPAAANGRTLLRQTYRGNVSTNASGEFTANLEKAFPNGIDSIFITVTGTSFGAWVTPNGGTLAGGAGGVAQVYGKVWTGASGGATPVASSSVPVHIVAEGW